MASLTRARCGGPAIRGRKHVLARARARGGDVAGVGGQGPPVKRQLVGDFCGGARNPGATALGDREESARLLPAFTFQLPTGASRRPNELRPRVLWARGRRPAGSAGRGEGRGRTCRNRVPGRTRSTPSSSPVARSLRADPRARTRGAGSAKGPRSWKRRHELRAPGSRL